MMRAWFVPLLAGLLIQTAAAALPPLPPALLLSVERDGEVVRQLPLCLGADGGFSASQQRDGAALEVSGRLQALRNHPHPLLSFRLSWRDEAGAQQLDSQLALEGDRQLLGGLPLLVYPYGKAPGVEPQRSSLTFYLEPRAACLPAAPDKAKE